MESTYQPHPDNLPFPELSKPPDIRLTAREEVMLRGVYKGYARLILEKEFYGGYSGSRVFLVLPVRTDGGSDARVVSKLGLAVDLSREKANFDNYIKQALPFTGTQVGNYYEQDDLAALNYVFAGGEELGGTVSLEGYYSVHSAEEVIETLHDLLEFLGARWYSQSVPLNCSFREEYGRHLPPHAELERITAKIFPRLIASDHDRLQIPAIPDRYPNPLKVYPRILDQILEGRQSYVHGDLHLRNVLVDRSGKSWLIDFGKVRQRHNLFDFIKLEAYLRLMALATVQGAFSQREYLQFEAALNNPQFAPPQNQELRTAYRTILAIREMASGYMRNRRNLSKEYLPALFLYCLALMKYHSVNGDAPTQLMFLTCCALGQFLLGGDHPGSETFLVEQGVPDTRHDHLELAYQPYKREQDAAVPKHVTVSETTQLLVLMRQGDSQELKTITETEVASAVKNEIIQSPPFELEFPLTKNGQPAPVELGLELDAPDFTPPFQHHLIPVPLTGDPQFHAFNVTPNIIGELPLTLRIYKGDVCISSYPLRISSGSENYASRSSGVISILLNVAVEQVDRSFPGNDGSIIETGLNNTTHGTRTWARSLKWWGIGASLLLLALMVVIGGWLWANLPFLNKPAPVPSITPAIVSTSMLSAAPTHVFITDTPLTVTSVSGNPSESTSLVIVEKLEDRSHGGYQGANPAESIYEQIAAQVQKDELPLDVRYLEQAPDNAMLNQASETTLPILVLSGWHDSKTITFHLELFAVVDQFHTVQKTDEFNGTIGFPGQTKYLSLFVLGTERYISGDNDIALGYLNNALLMIHGAEATIKPGDVYYLRGLIFHARGDRTRAIADYTQAIEYKPEIAEYYNCRGAAEDETGRFQQAVDDYGAAIDIQAEAKFYMNRANTYAHMGDYQRAIADYTQAIALDAEYVEAYHYRGLAYDSIGDSVHAIADYTQAIQIQPDYAEAYSDRGTTHYYLEEIDQAIADYTQAISIDPQLEEAYNNRGNAYRRKGLYELALTDLNKAIDLDPRDYIAYYNRGLTYEEMGEKEKAIADFKEALALNPSQEVQQRVEQELRELGEK